MSSCDLNIEILGNSQTNVSSQSRVEIQGRAPFKQSGVYEAQIAITDSQPSADSIKTKQFTVWVAKEEEQQGVKRE